MSRLLHREYVLFLSLLCVWRVQVIWSVCVACVACLYSAKEAGDIGVCVRWRECPCAFGEQLSIPWNCWALNKEAIKVGYNSDMVVIRWLGNNYNIVLLISTFLNEFRKFWFIFWNIWFSRYINLNIHLPTVGSSYLDHELCLGITIKRILIRLNC